MRLQRVYSTHWTDEQLVAHLYGVGPDTVHLDQCLVCQARLNSMRAVRRTAEAPEHLDSLADCEFLSRQRRAIYEKLVQPARWWQAISWRSWASLAATVIILGGGAAVYQEKRLPPTKAGTQLSDAQLAQEVSKMSQESEAQLTAPLQGLFE